MRTHTRIKWPLLLMAVVAQTSFGADELVHPRIEVGASFLFTQMIEEPGVKRGPYAPRLDAWARNGAGGIIFTIASGPKKEAPKNTILQTYYGLGAEDCIVDVFSGVALATGASCAQPLPTDRSWVAKDQQKVTYECHLMPSPLEHVSVPAGEFDATKIECRKNIGAESERQLINYWYVPSIGAMVKTIYHSFDAAGAERSIIMELASYQAP